MRPGFPSFPMADFSNSLPDPLEAARRRYGFAAPEDLDALDRLVALAAREEGGATLSLGDRGGLWYETAHGVLAGVPSERRLSMEGTDVEGLLRMGGPAQEALIEDVAILILEFLKLRRLGAERRRQPRGPEGASFVPGVVHELRNFLFAMSAGLDAFAARFEGQGEAAGHAEAIRRNLGRLQDFLQELHEYGNPGALTFALAPLVPVAAQALRLAEPLAAARDIQVAFHPLDRAPLERMDRAALEGALRRLAELAMLETAANGTVEVATQLREGPGRPWMEVLITGRPCRSRDLDAERVFEPFYYRHKDMSRLGPAIARRIIEAHGGQLGAAFGDNGAVLRILLPVWPPEGVEAAP